MFWKVCWNGDTLVLITFINLFSLGMLFVEVYSDNVRIIGGNRADLILIATMFNFIIITVQYAVFSFPKLYNPTL